MGLLRTVATFIDITAFLTFCVAVIVAPGECIRLTIGGEPYPGLEALLGLGFLVGLIFGVPLGAAMTFYCRPTSMVQTPADPLRFQTSLEAVLQKQGYLTTVPGGWLKVYSYTEGEGSKWLRFLPVSLDLTVRFKEGIVQLEGPDLLIKEIGRNLKS